MYKGEGKEKGIIHCTGRGRGRGGRHVQKVVKCIRERGASRRERKRRGTCLERKE